VLFNSCKVYKTHPVL